MKKIINVTARKQIDEKIPNQEILINILREGQSNLKTLDNTITMLKNNAAIKGIYSKKNIKVFNELKINRYVFYITLIGALDAKILELKNFIVMFLKDDILCDAAEEVIAQKELYQNLRDDITRDFLNLEKCVSTDENSAIIKCVLEYPLYKNFQKLFESCNLNDNETQIHFIKAYIKGFELGFDTKIEDVINEYRVLYEDLSIHMSKNERLHERVKLKYCNK